jgi:hypothetical protein
MDAMEGWFPNQDDSRHLVKCGQSGAPSMIRASAKYDSLTVSRTVKARDIGSRLVARDS